VRLSHLAGFHLACLSEWWQTQSCKTSFSFPSLATAWPGTCPVSAPCSSHPPMCTSVGKSWSLHLCVKQQRARWFKWTRCHLWVHRLACLFLSLVYFQTENFHFHSFAFIQHMDFCPPSQLCEISQIAEHKVSRHFSGYPCHLRWIYHLKMKQWLKGPGISFGSD
jgi:hypothetical protein